jgi:NodT family efflux transporter outer membrane factor (OMF) lipoprotein
MARTASAIASLAMVSMVLSGCMVGPDYQPPPAPVADAYRDPESDAVKQDPAELAEWWTVFGDPALNDLVEAAYRQNPTLRTAAVRVLEAEARRGFAFGLLFPQQQAGFGGYSRNRISENAAGVPGNIDRSFDDWQVGAAASWELDVWGRFRRGIESADADVLASLANYDDVLVTLVANVATEYISIRVLQERLAVARANVEVQRRGLDIAETRFKAGTATDLDRAQAMALLRDTEALIPDFEAQVVQAENRLCILLGIPPQDLLATLGESQPIPTAPQSVAIGIPADLLRRRPDVRRAERELAAQSPRIGIAKADLYPAFSLVGDVRLQSENFSNLFEGDSLAAFGGPQFRWNLFNYGRIENNVRVEDARFQALIGVYEDTVLRAQTDVENSIAGYLGAQRQVTLLNDSVDAAKRAVQVAEEQYRGGIADYTRVLLTDDFLQDEQDRWVSTRGAVALNLVSLYRALGGGWEIRGDGLPIDEQTRKQMKERSNWGKYLD